MSKLAVNVIMVGKAAEAEKKGAEQDAAEVRNAAAKVKGVSAKPLQPQTKKELRQWIIGIVRCEKIERGYPGNWDVGKI